MKKLKRIIPLMLVLVMSLSIFLVACNKDKGDENGDGDNPPAVTTWKVTFDYNYSGLEDTTKQVVYTSTYGDLPAPTREGYSFLGWYDTVVATDLTIPASTSGSSNSRAVKYNAVPGAVYQVSIDKASVTAGTGTVGKRNRSECRV